jgi:hypothetical protein
VSNPQGGSTASSPSDPTILEGLRQATRKDHVRHLLQRHDVEQVNAAWRRLTPVERSALLLCKHFDGTIIPDYSESD